MNNQHSLVTAPHMSSMLSTRSNGPGVDISEIPTPEAAEAVVRDIIQRFGLDAARFQSNSRSLVLFPPMRI